MPTGPEIRLQLGDVTRFDVFAIDRIYKKIDTITNTCRDTTTISLRGGGMVDQTGRAAIGHGTFERRLDMSEDTQERT